MVCPVRKGCSIIKAGSQRGHLWNGTHKAAQPLQTGESETVAEHARGDVQQLGKAKLGTEIKKVILLVLFDSVEKGKCSLKKGGRG